MSVDLNIFSLTTKLAELEKEIHVHRTTAHSAFKETNATKPYYFGSLAVSSFEITHIFRIFEIRRACSIKL
jgi:hypothetical protein